MGVLKPEAKERGRGKEIMEHLTRGSPLNRRTYLICRTVRSGQRYKYPGNVVVVGDVHPGGEIIASGHVIVMGNLMGMVHAGAEGDERAVVIAFSLQPLQLRIAGYVSRSPDGEKREKKLYFREPEIARVENEEIIIEKYSLGGNKDGFKGSRRYQEEEEKNG